MAAEDARNRLEELAAGQDDLAVKGKKTPYLAVNGNMFAFVSPEGALCLRFAEDQRAKLAEEFGTGEVLQYGSVMKGYVEIPTHIWPDNDRMARLFTDCVAHARQLKPKPTKKSG